MNKVNTDIAPSWFPNKTPEERVYWRAGVINLSPTRNGWLKVYTSERTAWKAREMFLRHPTHSATHDAPYPVTREEASAQAMRDYGYRRVGVEDEQGNIVEEWTV